MSSFIPPARKCFISENNLLSCVLSSIQQMTRWVLIKQQTTVFQHLLNWSMSSGCVNIGRRVPSSRCCWLCPQRPGRSTSRCCRSPCWCWSSCWWTWRWTGPTWRCEPCAASWSVRRPASRPRTSISFWRTTPARLSTSPAPQGRCLDQVSATWAKFEDRHCVYT